MEEQQATTYELYTREQLPRAPSGRSCKIMDVDVNCFNVKLAHDAPTEFFKYDVSAVSRRQQRHDAPTGVTTGGGAAAAGHDQGTAVEAAQAPHAQEANDGPPHAVPMGDVGHVAPPATDQVASRPLPKRLMRAIVGELFCQHSDVFDAVRAVHGGMAGIIAPRRIGDWAERVFEGVVVAKSGSVRHDGVFDVTVKLVAMINVDELRQYADLQAPPVNPSEALQALDIVLRHLGSQRFLPIGQNLYSAKNVVPLTNRTTELYGGTHQSLHMGSPQLFLNVDTAASVFYKQGALLDLVCAVAQVRDPSELAGCRDRWTPTVKGLCVKTTHRPVDPVQAIYEVAPVGADQMMIQLGRGGDAATRPTVSIQQYFQERYTVQLRFPQVPVVNVGTARRPAWLPMELCEVAPSQRVKDASQVDPAAVAKHCCKKPATRKSEIENAICEAGYENDPYSQAFGLEVSRKMEAVIARVLKPPTLTVAWDRSKAAIPATPQHGSWQQRRLYRGMPLSAWCVVNLSSLEPRVVESFVSKLGDEMGRNGLTVVQTRPRILSWNRGTEHYHQAIGRLMKQAYDEVAQSIGDRLILVVNDTQGSDYTEIKRMSDSFLGVASQCVLAKHIRGLNVALSQPLKLLDQGRTIIFGADIDHPQSPRQPTIAAVVASMDGSAAGYVGRVTPLTSSGLSDALPTLLCELLAKFEQRNSGVVPTKIVFFRGGVNNGRLATVFEAEIKAIHRAWALFRSGTPTPPITFVMVSRHHHLRAFAQAPRDADRSGNVPVGTVIDSNVVDPRRAEFYLYGHAGILGTSRPAQYTVVLDDNKLTSPDMEQLCFDLCHMFGRTTRSVSVVAPIYFAQILAARGRVLLSFRANNDETETASTDSDTSSSGGGGSNGMPGEPVIEIHQNLRNSLFFT